MTRDEAIAAVRMAVREQRREPEINITELLVDAMFALGVLKLEEQSPRSEAFIVRNVADWREPARCEPPPEHQDKRWHWIKVDRDLCCAAWTIPGFAADKRRGTWSMFSLELSETEAGNQGWRYVAPCLPPE